MVDVNEPTAIQQKLDRQWTLLDEANIDGRDRDTITAFVEWRRDVSDQARSTLANDLSALRNASIRADCPLVDMSLEDVEDLFVLLATPKDDGGYGIDPEGTGLFGYARALRIYFRYMDRRDRFDAYPFHEDIELPEIDIRGAKERDEMLTGEDIEALKAAAKYPRDRAMIALFGDIGGRAGMVLSLRVGDIHLEGDEPYITPNDQVIDGLKGIDDIQIPILHSRAELRTYLNNDFHPDPETDMAPLWPIERGYDYDDPQQCAVSGSRARGMLAAVGERAGVEKPVNPHNFRRTAATRLSNSERLTPQEIQQITGWKSSTLSDMIDIYDYTEDAERNSQIHQALGFSDGEETRDGDLEIGVVTCGTCKEDNPGTSRFCANCGNALDRDVAEVVDETEDTIVFDLSEIDDPVAREGLRDLFDRLGVEPDVGVGDHASGTSSS